MTTRTKTPGAGTASALHDRLEHLLALSKRIGDAIAADIQALEYGTFGDLSASDPEFQRLCALYGREVMALKAAGGIKGAPAALVAELKKSGARMKELLTRHERLVGCMRQASEGLIKAVADEVERMRCDAAPYGSDLQGKRSTGGAIVYNKII